MSKHLASIADLLISRGVEFFDFIQIANKSSCIVCSGTFASFFSSTFFFQTEDSKIFWKLYLKTSGSGISSIIAWKKSIVYIAFLTISNAKVHKVIVVKHMQSGVIFSCNCTLWEQNFRDALATRVESFQKYVYLEYYFWHLDLESALD